MEAPRRRWPWQRAAPEDLALPALFSREALRRAWLQVRANRGAAGVDGVTVRAFERELERHLTELQAELVEGRYRPQPVRRILVPKASGGQRPLALWVLRDRLVQRLLYDYLEPLYEPVFLPCSVGFRPGRGIADALRLIEGARDANQRWVVDGDIRDCFDSIPPERLLRRLRERLFHPAVLRLVELFLAAHIFNDPEGRTQRAGVSQGSALSPLLCNIYLHEFDQRLSAAGYTLVRYADDWLLLCRRRQEALEGWQAAARALAALKLELHPQKSRVVHFDEGFKFLGHFFIRREIFSLDMRPPAGGPTPRRH